MDIAQESPTDNHVQDQTASHRKKRPKINGATEAPPAKRIKSSTDSARPRLSRVAGAPTTRTRTAKFRDSKWLTVVPSIEYRVPSDLVLVDARPRLWSMNRAELGAAFVEISDSKCVNGISWASTDMPILILDNESMVLEKSKDARNELSMDLVLIREFRYANPNTVQKDADSPLEYLSHIQVESSSRPVHSLPATPSMIGETPDGLPMDLPVSVAKHATATFSTPDSLPIPESKPGETLQRQGTINKQFANKLSSYIPPRTAQKEPTTLTAEAHLNPTPPLVTKNSITQTTEGGRPSKGPRKTADRPLLRPIQDAVKSEELESSNNDSVPAHHGSTTVPDISNSNAGVAPRRKRVKPPKVQCNPSDESLLGPEKAAPRSEDQEKLVIGPPLASTQIPDPSEYRSISAAKSKQEGKKRDMSLKSSSKSLRDTAQNLSRSQKRENAEESFVAPAKIPVPSESSTAPTPKLTQGGQPEVPRKRTSDSPDAPQGELPPKEQKKRDNEIPPIDIPTSGHADSISTARLMVEGRKAVSKSRKTVRLATDESLQKSDTGSLSRLITGEKSKGAKERKRKDAETVARELSRSDPLPKSKGEGVQRSEKATKGPSKRVRSPGPSMTTSAYARKSNSGQKVRGVPVRNRRSECASQPPQKKEYPKPIKESLSSGKATRHVLSEHATEQNKSSAPVTSNVPHEQGQRKGSETRSKSATVLGTLRFKKYKDAPMHVYVPKTSDNSPDVPQSFPEEQRAHLMEQPPRPYTPDRSIPDELENIIRGQKGHFEPVFNHFPDNRLLPNFNRLPLDFVDQHDTLYGVRVAAGDVANFGCRTLNRMNGGRDEYHAGNVGGHVGSVGTQQGGTAGWGPPHWNQTPTGTFPDRNAPQSGKYVDRFAPDRTRFGSELRRAGGSRWEGPFAQNDLGPPRRSGQWAGPAELRTHSHSPAPSSPWMAPGSENRSRSVPYAKPPPKGPRAWLELQALLNSKTAVVTGASHDPATALSGSSNLSPNLQRSAVTGAQSEPSLALAASSIENTAMISLPDKLTLPNSSTQPFQSVVPDGTSLTNQMNTCLSPTTPSVNDTTMGSSAGEPLLPVSSVPVSIEPTSLSTSASPMPQVGAATDIAMQPQANEPALSAQTLPLSTTVPSPSLKRKGKEKASPPESSRDEPSIVQDEVRQAKKAKLWHDPIVDVSRILSGLGTPMACSSKTKLEDLPVPQSSRFPETPSQSSAMDVDDQVPSLSVSSSSLRTPKRRGRPPKNAKVASSISGSATAITPRPAHGKGRQRQSSSLSNSVAQSTCSSQTPAQATAMVVEDQLPSPSVSVAAKPVKRRGRQSQTAKVVASSSAAPTPVTSGSTLDELSSISGPLHETPLQARVESSIVPATPVQRREDGIPLPIPGEIQALVDAYINGVPIGIFASNTHIQGFWGLKLARGEEMGYAFMGFYRVCRVLESLEEGEVNDEEDERGKKGKGGAVVGSDISRTRVRWRFKLRWEPGGEGWQIRESQRLTSPWWNSNLNAQELAVVPQANSGDSDDESTEAYRLARRRNQNFSRRHCHFAQTFCSVLPLHLLAPVNAEIPDAVLPRGWHCPDCGKLNFRYYLRHRSCDSSYCRDKLVAQGYVVEVDRLRDPQDATALSLPLNVVPEYIRANSRIQVWKDRMKTLVYCFESAIAGVMPRVQHIFTCNLVDLQQVPSELFGSIQMDVPLRRSAGDAHMYPYFLHIVDEVRGKGEDTSSWMTAPQCLHRVKEEMIGRGRKYGKKTAAELDINKLIIRAWATSGSKRGSDLLQAKERCIVVMCLGCEVILSISPKSAMSPNDNQTRLPDLDKLIPMESLDPQEDQLTKPKPGESANLNLGEKEGQPHVVSASSTMRAVMGKNQRGEKVEMTLSLVHGDVVLLEGDDFEYSIKRTGTSILLFGLSASSRCPRQAPDSTRQ